MKHVIKYLKIFHTLVLIEILIHIIYNLLIIRSHFLNLLLLVRKMYKKLLLSSEPNFCWFCEILFYFKIAIYV